MLDNLFKKAPLNSEVTESNQDISWEFLGTAGGNYTAFKLIKKSDDIIALRPTNQEYFFRILFVIIGIGSIYYIYANWNNELPVVIRWGGLLYGIVLGFVAGLYPLAGYIISKKYFDKRRDSFFVGRNKKCAISDVKAIQLLYKRPLHRGTTKDSRDNSYAYDYQLNLVLKDNERVNVASHGGLDQMRKDSQLLSDFLSVSILDGIDDNYIENTYIPRSLD